MHHQLHFQPSNYNNKIEEEFIIQTPGTAIHAKSSSGILTTQRIRKRKSTKLQKQSIESLSQTRNGFVSYFARFYTRRQQKHEKKPLIDDSSSLPLSYSGRWICITHFGCRHSSHHFWASRSSRVSAVPDGPNGLSYSLRLRSRCKPLHSAGIAPVKSLLSKSRDRSCVNEPQVLGSSPVSPFRSHFKCNSEHKFPN